MSRRRSLTTSLVLILSASTAWAGPAYTALGASDAVGVGSSNYTTVGAPNNGYVYLIANWMKARYTPWGLNNLGISGAEATTIRDSELANAISSHPAIVTLWAGGNDVKNSVINNEATSALVARFQDAYGTIVRRLRQETGAYIVTCNLPDMSKLPVAAYLPASYQQLGHADSIALNNVIASVAAQYNVPVVDLFSDPRSTDQAYISSSDGFHPNDAGYALLAQKIESVLQANAWRIVSGLGDLDGDGNVAPADAAATLRLTAGLDAATDRQHVAADAAPSGGDGSISVADAVQILRRASGLVTDQSWY